MLFKIEVAVYFNPEKFFEFTISNGFISDCQFTWVTAK